ncbi:MAG: hypothetical protein Q8P67_27435 [archaeon]|nr:hypothetical protein [archaeon]
MHEDTRRLFKLDSDRTFAGPACRSFLSDFLATLVKTSLHGEYHQSLSLVSGLLLLWFDRETVHRMLHVVNAHPRYIPGYWRGEAVAFATDAYVFQTMLARHVPAVHQVLTEKGIMPEIWLQKWFVGLCINVLPFEHLHRFFGGFFRFGQVFLMRFGLSFAAHFETQLVQSPDQANVLAWLRLDEDKLKFVDAALLDAVLADALDETRFPLGEFDVPALRIHCYDTHLRARMESAAAARAQHDSDDSDDSDSDDSDDDSYRDSDDSDDDFGCGGGGDDSDDEGCENVPEHFCSDPPTLLCSDCRKKPAFKGKCVTPDDLYQFSRRPDIAEKLSVQKATAGIDKLKI